MKKREQTPREERINALTHAAGIVFCLIAGPSLVYYAFKNGSAASVWAVTVFGFGMLMVYLSSTLYHAAHDKHAKSVLRIWDHISIYLLIAGSYTPLVVKFIDTTTAIIFLSVMWTIVAAGSFLKIFYTGKFQKASTILYVGLGWMAVFIAKPLLHNLPINILWWLLAGGLTYTFGVIFYVREGKPYNHAIWHCFVLGGTILHYVAVFKSTGLNNVSH